MIELMWAQHGYPHLLVEVSLECLFGEELRRNADLPAPSTRITAPLTGREAGTYEVNVGGFVDPRKAVLKALRYCGHNG